jgi:hypothetical protein
MDEVTYYNLHATAASAGHAAKREANNYAFALMTTHLHLEHKMGIRDIANRMGTKMVEVKKIICPEKVAPELDRDEIERYRKRGRKLVWNFEKKRWFSKPINA